MNRLVQAITKRIHKRCGYSRRRNGMHIFARATAIGAIAVLSSSSLLMQAQTQELDLVGKDIITQLASRHFNEVETRFDDRMQAGLPQDKLSAVWDSLTGQAGPFHRIVRTNVIEQAGMRVIVITCEFERAALDARIAVDPQGRIAGLFFSPAAASQAGQAAWTAPSYANQTVFHEREVTVGNGQWKLPGTLTIPSGKGPFAAVVLVHGSGAEDQDETIGPNKPFKDLAWGLASQNIAVLRYVKRTKQYGAQSMAGRDFTVKDEVTDDAEAAVSLLAATPEIDHDHIYVLGHSLGGMLAPRIAAADKRVAGLIIAAGLAHPLQQTVVEQLKYIASLHGTAIAEDKQRIAAAEHARTEIDDPSLKPDSVIDLAGARLPGSYFLDLRSYHPAEVAAGLHIPILILQGGRDYQVTSKDYDLWKAAFAKDPRATFQFYPTLTHLFLPVTTPGPASPADYNIPGHVSSEVIQDIAHWVGRNSAAK